jgi:Flp pilus assembly protein TadD
MLIAWIGVLNPWSHNTLSAYPPLENLARTCLARPDRLPTEWIKDLIRATSVTPETGWLDLGLAYLDQRRLPDAEAALERAAAAKPDEPLPYYHLGIARDMMGHTAGAIAAYERLLALAPDNVGAWNNLIIFSLRAERLDLAERASRRSLELEPDNAQGTWGELMVEEARGKLDAEKLKAALRRHPDHAALKEMARRRGIQYLNIIRVKP